MTFTICYDLDELAGIQINCKDMLEVVNSISDVIDYQVVYEWNNGLNDLQLMLEEVGLSENLFSVEDNGELMLNRHKLPQESPKELHQTIWAIHNTLWETTNSHFELKGITKND